MRLRALGAVVVVALVLAPEAVAHAGKHRTTLSEIEPEVMCPTCGTTLQLANSPLAERQRAFILARVERGQTKEEIKAALVEEFGEQVLADPPRSGFAIAVYAVPLSALAGVLVLVGVALRRWRRARPPGEEAERSPMVDHDDDARLEHELARFGA